MNTFPPNPPVYYTQSRIVDVIRESERRRGQRVFISCCFCSGCWNCCPVFVEMADLYELLAHGDPGTYILRGA